MFGGNVNFQNNTPQMQHNHKVGIINPSIHPIIEPFNLKTLFNISDRTGTILLRNQSSHSSSSDPDRIIMSNTILPDDPSRVYMRTLTNFSTKQPRYVIKDYIKDHIGTYPVFNNESRIRVHFFKKEDGPWAKPFQSLHPQFSENGLLTLSYQEMPGNYPEISPYILADAGIVSLTNTDNQYGDTNWTSVQKCIHMYSPALAQYCGLPNDPSLIDRNSMMKGQVLQGSYKIRDKEHQFNFYATTVPIIYRNYVSNIFSSDIDVVIQKNYNDALNIFNMKYNTKLLGAPSSRGFDKSEKEYNFMCC